MGVLHFPVAPLDEQVMRLAAAAVIMARKKSPRAAERCRRRRERAVDVLFSEKDALSGAYDRPGLREGAASWLRLGCDICGLCEGVRVIPALREETRRRR